MDKLITAAVISYFRLIMFILITHFDNVISSVESGEDQNDGEKHLKDSVELIIGGLIIVEGIQFNCWWIIQSKGGKKTFFNLILVVDEAIVQIVVPRWDP